MPVVARTSLCAAVRSVCFQVRLVHDRNSLSMQSSCNPRHDWHSTQASTSEQVTRPFGREFRPLRQQEHIAFRQRGRFPASDIQSRRSICHSASKGTDSCVSKALNAAEASTALWLLSQLPADAADATVDFSKGSFSTQSYVVTLGLFLISLPGLWSQVKRAPKASIKRKTFEVEGPAKAGSQALDIRAKQIFLYFKKYNYDVKETGDTITFAGTYAASRGQAAALVFYVFCGLLSTALVLSIALPFGGQNWYWLAALSPLSGVYYWQRGTREEDFKVKMVTSDDEQTTDILVEGDKEEIERMTRELQLWEKGKVYVKGILEK